MHENFHDGAGKLESIEGISVCAQWDVGVGISAWLELLEARSDSKSPLYHSHQKAQNLISAGLGYGVTLGQADVVDANFPHLGT